MVFSGKIYDQVKEQLDKYLFGFDKSQLDVSLLKGAIKLQSVNIKPNKAEKFLKSLQLPFSLKAGTIGQLELKLNLMSMFSSDANSMHIELDSAFFILGPSLRSMSKDDSYLKESEQEMLESYDENNAFNIFTNNLKLRKKQDQKSIEEVNADAKNAAANKEKQAANVKDAQGLTNEQKDVIKGLTIIIRKLHLRYEDDYYSSENPYSFGIVLDELNFESSDCRIFFERLADMQARSANLSEMGYNAKNQLCKDLNLKNARVYWNCLSEMYIPTSLWESTRHMKYQIFEAMDAQQLNELMVQIFTERGQDQFQFVLKDLDVNSQLHCYDHTEPALASEQDRIVTCFNVSVLSPVVLRLNAQILNDLHQFVGRVQGIYLLKDLKQYRPHRRPITDVPDRIANSPSVKRKRKLIVRDWFFFVVWYVRLRKIINSFYQKADAGSSYLIFDPKYRHLLEQVLNKKIDVSQLISEIETAKNKNKPIWPFKNEINLRMKSFELNLFKEQLFDVKAQRDYPKLSLHANRLAVNFSMGGVPSQDRDREEKLTLQAQLGGLELSTYHQQQLSSSYSHNQQQQTTRPKQLTQLLLKQEVVVHQAPGQSQAQIAAGQMRPPSATPNKLIASLASAVNRSNHNNINYGSNSNQATRTAPNSKNAAAHPQNPYGVNSSINQPSMNQQVSYENNKTSLISQQQYFDNEKSQTMQRGANLNSLMSPGRKMIGPKFQPHQPQHAHDLHGNPLMMKARSVQYHQGDPQQPQPQPKQESRLKKSASKDSLVSNMLLSVTKFLGGGSTAVDQNDQQTHDDQGTPLVSETEDHQSAAARDAGSSAYNNYTHQQYKINDRQDTQRNRSPSKVQEGPVGRPLEKEVINGGYKRGSIQQQASHISSDRFYNRSFNAATPGQPASQTPNHSTLQQHKHVNQSSYSGAASTLQMSNNNAAKKPRPGATGLEQLLKGSSRLAQNRSFNQSILQTEHAPAMDTSVMLGQTRQINSYAEHQDDEEDIVIDSGGRQINHVSNWHASSKNNYHQQKNSQNYQRSMINDGILNKTHIGQAGHKNNASRAASTTSFYSNQVRNNNNILSSNMRLGGLIQSPGSTSTLGTLLGNSKLSASNHAANQHQYQKTINTQRAAADSYQQPPGNSYQNNSNRLTSQATIAMGQQTTHVADDTCNVLPSQRLTKSSQMIKERLLSVHGCQATTMQGQRGSNDTAPVAHVEYKLLHERRLAREVGAELGMGRVEVTYSNNSLASLSDLLIEAKQLPSFRDINIIPNCLKPRQSSILLLDNINNRLDITPEKAEAEKEWNQKLASMSESIAEIRNVQNRSSLNNETKKKAKQVNNLIQKCQIDLKIRGDRLYISFFDDQTRDQVCKFVSPPVSFGLTVHQRNAQTEASYELFGFQFQQSTDLNLLGNFASAFHGQFQMLKSNEHIKKGHDFYQSLIEEHRKKEDEKRHITQLVFRRQSNVTRGQFSNGFMDSIGAGVKPKAEGSTGIEELKKQGATTQNKKLNINKGPLKSSFKPCSNSNQAIKPGKSINKLNSTEKIPAIKSDGQQYSMVSRGLMITECPSKQINANKYNDNSDNDDIPYPDDDDDDEEPVVENESSEEGKLRDKLESQQTDNEMYVNNAARQQKQLDHSSPNTALPLINTNQKSYQSVNKRLRSYQSSQGQEYDTFNGDSAGCAEPTLDIQDLKSPRREILHQIIPPTQGIGRRPLDSNISTNSNLRQATNLQMTQAFVQLGQSSETVQIKNVENNEPVVINTGKIAAIEFGHPLNNNTHTDSAGGEACDNEEENPKIAHRTHESGRELRKNSHRDQDEPLLDEQPPNNDQARMKQLQMKSSDSAGSDLQVFEDPSIQNDPKLTGSKRHSIADQRSDGTNRLPPGLPVAPQNRPGMEQTKRWKSTRETQNFQLKKKQPINNSNSSSKLHAMIENNLGSGDRKNNCYTPNNILNFSRQISQRLAPRGDESPSIKSQPLIQSLDAHSKQLQSYDQRHQAPPQRGIIAISPSKRHHNNPRPNQPPGETQQKYNK